MPTKQGRSEPLNPMLAVAMAPEVAELHSTWVVENTRMAQRLPDNAAGARRQRSLGWWVRSMTLQMTLALSAHRIGSNHIIDGGMPELCVIMSNNPSGSSQRLAQAPAAKPDCL